MAGTQISLNDDYDEQYNQARQKMSHQLDEQDKKINEFYAQNPQKTSSSTESSPSNNLPPELRAKFDEMLKNMKDWKIMEYFLTVFRKSIKKLIFKK